MTNILQELIKLANSFDRRGLRKEADMLDNIIAKAIPKEDLAKTEYGKFLAIMKSYGGNVHTGPDGYSYRVTLKNGVVISAVCRDMSYGGSDGKIEMGAWARGEDKMLKLDQYDSVKGHLTADKAMALVKKLEGGWEGASNEDEDED